MLTWLCTVCRREIAGWREREGKVREVSFSDDRPEMRAVLERWPPSRRTIRRRCRRRELSGLVQLTLDHLPGRYGDVLEWKYMQGLSVDEIADRLGVGYKAAESLLTRARAAFRDGFSFVPATCWTDGRRGIHDLPRDHERPARHD